MDDGLVYCVGCKHLPHKPGECEGASVTTTGRCICRVASMPSKSETPYSIPSRLEQEIQKASVQLGLMIAAFQQAAAKIEAATVRLGEEMSRLTKELDRAVEAGREAGRQ